MKPYYEDSAVTIYHGDCREILPTLPKVDLVLTDPPYGMAYQSSRRTDKHEKIEGDTDLSWFGGWSKEVFRILKDDTHIYIFANEYSMDTFRKGLVDSGFIIKRMLVWVKNNHTSGDLFGDYANKTEYILFAHKGRRELGGNSTNVFDLRRENTDNHPTQKPISICYKLAEKSSHKGDTILDPFMGSGTTLRAAKDLGRKAIGIELEEKYCEIAAKRMSQEVFDFK